MTSTYDDDFVLSLVRAKVRVEQENEVYRFILGDLREALDKFPPEEVRLQVLKDILGKDHPFVQDDSEFIKGLMPR